MVELDTGDPSLGVAGKLTVRPSQSQLLPLGPFDGAGTSLARADVTFPGLADEQTLVSSITEPASMQRFAAAGGGTVTMDASPPPSPGPREAGTCPRSSTPSAGATLTVAYRYLIPSIEINKTPNDQVVNPGDEATFDHHRDQRRRRRAHRCQRDRHHRPQLQQGCRIARRRRIDHLYVRARRHHPGAGQRRQRRPVPPSTWWAATAPSSPTTTHVVTVTTPAIDIEKTANPTAVLSGGNPPSPLWSPTTATQT